MCNVSLLFFLFTTKVSSEVQPLSSQSPLIAFILTRDQHHSRDKNTFTYKSVGAQKQRERDELRGERRRLDSKPGIKCFFRFGVFILQSNPQLWYTPSSEYLSNPFTETQRRFSRSFNLSRKETNETPPFPFGTVSHLLGNCLSPQDICLSQTATYRGGLSPPFDSSTS